MFSEIAAIFESGFIYTKSSPDMTKVLEDPQWILNVLGEKDKIILPFMENAPINVKLGLSWRIADQGPSQKACLTLSQFSRDCLFNKDRRVHILWAG